MNLKDTVKLALAAKGVEAEITDEVIAKVEEFIDQTKESHESKLMVATAQTMQAYAQTAVLLLGIEGREPLGMKVLAIVEDMINDTLGDKEDAGSDAGSSAAA